MLTCYTSSTGLPTLLWQTYEVPLTSGPISLAPTNIAITSYSGDGVGNVTFTCSGGILWARVGQFVNVSGIVEYPNLNQTSFLITAVDYTNTTITCKIPTNPQNYGTNTFSATSAASGTPIISMVAMAQRVYFKTKSGAGDVQVSVDDISLNRGYGQITTYSSGTVYGPIFMPRDFKFNLGDWYGISTSGTTILQIMYI
jgi:hypothetical protein